MVVLIFLGGVLRMLGYPLNWTADSATCAVRLGLLPLRRHRVAQQQPDVDRDPHRPAAAALQQALRMLNYAMITVFLLYLIVMGIYLSWISRVRSFQGIPEISYSWVTMSLPVGALLLLITTMLKVRERVARRARRKPCRRRAVSAHAMLIVLIAFTVLMLLGMPVAFAIGISGTLFFLQHPGAAVHHPDPAHRHGDAEFRAARGAAVHPRRQLPQQFRHLRIIC